MQISSVHKCQNEIYVCVDEMVVLNMHMVFENLDPVEYCCNRLNKYVLTC